MQKKKPTKMRLEPLGSRNSHAFATVARGADNAASLDDGMLTPKAVRELSAHDRKAPVRVSWRGP